MKKVFFLFLFLLLFTMAGAEETDLTVKTKEGREYSLRFRSIKDTPYVSLPDLTRLLDQSQSGFRVEWDSTFGVLRLTRGPDNYSLFLDKTTLLVNTQILQVEHPVRVIAGEILIPLSSLEILGRLWKEFTFIKGGKKPPAPAEPSVTPTPEPEEKLPEKTLVAPPEPRFPAGQAFLHVMIDPATTPLSWERKPAETANLPSQDALTLQIALGVKRILEREGTIEVSLSSRGDETPTLKEKIDRINTSGADVLVALRLEASRFDTLEGVEILVASSALDPSAQNLKNLDKDDILPAPHAYIPYQRESLSLANTLLREIEKSIPGRVGPITPAPHYLLRRTAMPSVLVTLGYVTNPKEATRLARERYIESLARALAAGLLKFKETP